MQKLISLFLLCWLVAPPHSSYGQNIRPVDTYMLVNGIVGDLNKIHEIRSVKTPIQSIAYNASKTPTDVYHLAYELAEKLEELNRQYLILSEFKASLPPMTEGRKIPADVVAVLKPLKSMTNQLCQKLGAEVDRKSRAPMALRTPPDVYQKIQKSILLVDSLL
jgi:hypothetical protein